MSETRTASVPLGLLLDLLAHLERRVGGGRRFDRQVSRLIDRLRDAIEAGR